MLRHAGMGDVVNASAATATIRPVHFLQLQFGNSFQQIPRLVAHPLAVREMARVLIGRRYLQGRQPADEAQTGEKFRGILYESTESFRFLCVGRIVAEEMVVLFHSGAAAGRIDNDGIDTGVEKNIDVSPGHFFRRLALAVVNVERAAANLISGKDDVAAIASQHPDGCSVYFAEKKRHDATVEHRNPGPACSDGRKRISVRREKML